MKSPSTVPKQFEGDQSTQPNPRSGTPYTSRVVNDDQIKSTHYGAVPVVAGGVNLSNPASNGNGTLFDGISHPMDNLAPPKPTLDSPVPTAANRVSRSMTRQEDTLHIGEGAQSGIGDGLLGTGGVMSRGIEEG